MGRMAEQWQEQEYAGVETLSDTKTLTEALLDAQSEMRNPSLDTTNPHFRSRFASLAGVRAAVLPVLNKHGIALVQDLTTTERGVACRTILLKGSERMEFGPLEIPATKGDAQGFGSAATYARRYSLQTAVCVVGDDDDDANAASKPAVTKLDPMDRENLSVTAEHGTYAAAFRKALADGDDLKVVQNNDDANAEGEEFYRAVWSLLNSKERAAISATLKRIKNA